MKLNKYLFIALNTLIIAFTFYIAGCISSPETTTGKLAFQQKDFEKAEIELTKGVATDKEDIEAWYMLGVSRIEVGKFEESKVCFEKSKSTFGSEILNYWGIKFTEGISNFNEGYKARTKGDTALFLSKINNAINYFKAASIIIPDSAIGKQLLGESYALVGKNENAWLEFNQILDKPRREDDAENMARSMYLISFDYIQLEQYETAFEISNKIMAIKNLPKTNKYYSYGSFNSGLVKYLIGTIVYQSKTTLDSLNQTLKNETDIVKKEKIQKSIDKINNYTEKGDTKKYFIESESYFVPFIEVSKEKKLLSQAYDVLLTIYDFIGEKTKYDDIANKKLALEKEQ